MNLNALAFFTGLFGSLHCVAMCGPLVMALPLSHRSAFHAFIQRLVYQGGRILTYVVLGLLFGWIGQNFNLLGWQQGISILTGAALVIIACMHFSKKRITSVERLQLKLVGPLSIRMGKLLIKPYGGFLAGMLNGILPCGMVYLALAGAINTNSMMAGVQFMFFFGLGTTPLMLMAAVAGMYFRKWAQVRFSKLLPYLTLVMGIWFLLRGAELGIPFLSPQIEISKSVICN
jgi:uncharacterized protein